MILISMSNGEIDRIKQNQKEVEEFLNQYLQANRQNLDEFLKRTHDQYQTYIIGQIELLQNQIKSAIQTGNDMMIAFNKSLLDTWINMLE
jgi:hypothetical protein